MKYTFLLVHGAWHGAWCWRSLLPLLHARGYDAFAFDLPGHGGDPAAPYSVGLDDYIDRVVNTVNITEGRVILVGHSMAGVVIAAAADTLGKGKVAALVFLDAFMPRSGDSVFSLAAFAESQAADKANLRPVTECITPADNGLTAVFKPDMLQDFFYHDCSAADVAFAMANISPQPFAPLGTPVMLTTPDDGSPERFYILCTKSRDLDKRVLSLHVPCRKIYELESSHSPFFSMPEALRDILEEIYSITAAK